MMLDMETIWLVAGPTTQRVGIQKGGRVGITVLVRQLDDVLHMEPQSLVSSAQFKNSGLRLKVVVRNLRNEHGRNIVKGFGKRMVVLGFARKEVCRSLCVRSSWCSSSERSSSLRCARYQGGPKLASGERSSRSSLNNEFESWSAKQMQDFFLKGKFRTVLVNVKCCKSSREIGIGVNASPAV